MASGVGVGDGVGAAAVGVGDGVTAAVATGVAAQFMHSKTQSSVLEENPASAWKACSYLFLLGASC